MKKGTGSILLPPLMSLLMLVGIILDQRSRIGPEKTEPFHRSAAVALDKIPMQIGSWQGSITPLKDAVMQLLKPNATLSRQYRDTSARDSLAHDRVVSILVIQSRDARDMIGHYPPNCYPSSGEAQMSAIDRLWVINGVSIPGREYQFYSTNLKQTPRKAVYNVLLVPGKGMFRDMEGVNRAAEDYQQRYYGAAQLQVVMNADLPEEQRNAIIELFLGSFTDYIKLLLNPET